MSSAGLSAVKQGGNLKESGARLEWMESRKGGMSTGKFTEEGKAEGEGQWETQETLWESKERLVM